MTNTGTAAVQKRDTPVQADEAAQIGTPWQPRPDDGSRAVLVSERRAVFLRKADTPVYAELPEEVTGLGPMPTDWTWDLVHCRLVSVHALFVRLPPPRVPALYRSFLGNLQPQEAGPLRRPLSPAEDARLNWTWDRLFCWSEIDRAVLMGVMSGKSLSMISKITFAIAARHGGDPLRKTAVHKRYRRNTTTMAEEWKAARVPVDEATCETWLNKASKKV